MSISSIILSAPSSISVNQTVNLTTSAVTGNTRPDETNTGLAVEMGGSLTGLTNSSLTTLTAGQTYTGLKFLNNIQLASNTTIVGCELKDATAHSTTFGAQANNVTIKNSKIVGSVYNQALSGPTTYQGTNLLIENCEVTHSAGNTEKGLLIGNATVRRCYIHDVGSDGIWQEPTDSLIIEYSYITRCGKYRNADHIDGMQCHNPCTGVIVRYNHISVPNSFYQSGEGATWPAMTTGGGLNSCLTFQSDWGAISNCQVYGNWFQGGSYTLRLEAKGGFTVTNINLYDNSFGTDYEYGPFKHDSPDGSAPDPTYTASNNRKSYPNAASTSDPLAFT